MNKVNKITQEMIMTNMAGVMIKTSEPNFRSWYTLVWTASMLDDSSAMVRKWARHYLNLRCAGLN